MTDFSDIWYQSSDGLTLYARDYDSASAGAPVILCMHGLTRNSADFAGLALHLAPRYRVLVADQRGRGASEFDSQPENYQPATYVRDMFTLLDHLEVDRVVLIGTSMGGLMSMMMASLDGARIGAIVLNDIGPEVNPAGLERIKSYVGQAGPVTNWQDAVTQAKRINGSQFPDFTEDEWQEFTRALYREEAGVPVLSYDPAIAAPIAAADEAAVPPDLWPMFEALAMPVLVLRGATSDILAGDCAQQMQQRGQHCRMVEIPLRGHAPTLNEPLARQAIDELLMATR